MKIEKIKQKRYKTRISPYYMAKLLGIHPNTYVHVEEGKRILPPHLLEKFSDIMANKKEHQTNYKMELAEATAWMNTIDVKKFMKEVGLSQKDISDKLPISQPQTNSVINRRKIGTWYDLMIKDFLENSLNHLKPRKTKEEPKRVDSIINKIEEVFVDKSNEEVFEDLTVNEKAFTNLEEAISSQEDFVNIDISDLEEVSQHEEVEEVLTTGDTEEVSEDNQGCGDTKDLTINLLIARVKKLENQNKKLKQIVTGFSEFINIGDFND